LGGRFLLNKFVRRWCPQWPKRTLN
jgi:hypothetical protein